MSAPVCDRCNDTHVMTLRDREVMCTACPVPCKSCGASFCYKTPCACGCHVREYQGDLPADCKTCGADPVVGCKCDALKAEIAKVRGGQRALRAEVLKWKNIAEAKTDSADAYRDQWLKRGVEMDALRNEASRARAEVEEWKTKWGKMWEAKEGFEQALSRLHTALAEINDIRNSIVGTQSLNWSEHIYPLVAALNAAGFKGLPYPEARERVGTLIERTNKAEVEVARLHASNAALVEALKSCRSSLAEQGHSRYCKAAESDNPKSVLCDCGLAEQVRDADAALADAQKVKP